MKRILAILSIWSVLTSLAAATNYYVSPGGNNANNGLSPATAWASIERGDDLGVLNAGDTVWVSSGTYSRSSTIYLTRSGNSAQPIVYARRGKAPAIVDFLYLGQDAIIIEANYIVIQAITVKNSKDDGIQIQGSNCRISECVADNSGQIGFHVYGNNNLLLRNTVYSTTGSGIKNENSASNTLIYSNTIYNGNNDGITLGDKAARIFNNIIVDNKEGINGKAINVCGFNNVWGNSGGNYTGGVSDSAGGISSAPRFVNVAAGRFDLMAGSPEIDAGLNLGYFFNGSRPDIGAFEKYNVYYVSMTGNDTKDGRSLGNAWRTIDNGNSLLFPGDTVHILAGTYPDSVIVTDSGLTDDQIVYAAIRDSSALRGAWHYGVCIRGEYLRLDGLGVTGAGGDGFYITGSNNELNECRADSTGQFGVHVASGMNNSITHTLVSNSGVTGLVVEGSGLSVLHGTFVNNGDFDIDAATAADLELTNCILVGGNAPLAAVRAPTSAYIRYCEFFNHATWLMGGATTGPHCFSADPRFLDQVSGNYRLQATSPAIDAGKDVGVSYEGPAPDLGAYETGVPVSLSIIPHLDSLAADSQYQFSIAALDSLGFPAKPGLLSWSHTFSSGNINGSGLFTPRLVDTGSIIVESLTYGLVDTTAPMWVVPGRLAGMEIIPDRETVSADSSLLFTASGYDSKGNIVFDLGALSWSVLNGIGTIDNSGLFSAGRTGSGFVRTASAYGITGTSDTITVVPGEVVFIDVQPAVNIVIENSTCQYSALGYDADSNLAADLTASAIWSTTDTSGNVNALGLYTAGTKSSPPAYWVRSNWGGLTDSGQVFVISNGLLAYIRIEYVNGIPVDDTTLTTDNDTTRIYSRGYDSGDNLLGDIACTWSIIGTDSIGKLVSPSGTSTRLRLLGVGTGRVVANYSGGLTDTSGIIRCQPGIPAQVVISPDTAMSVSADSFLTFTAEFFDADGNVAGETPTSIWGVIGGIGSVDSSGQFAPEQAGNGYVFVSAGAMADTSAPITVSPGTLVRIEVSPDAAIVTADSSVIFTAAGFDAKDNIRDAGLIIWQLSEPVGSIDSSGFFDAVTAGSSRVIAVSNLGPVDTSAVLQVLPGALRSIVVSPDSLEISADSLASFTVVGFDGEGNSVAPNNVDWSTAYSLGDMNGMGGFDPRIEGIDRVIARCVAGADTIIDTTRAVVILPGALNRLNINPNTATLGIADSLQFSLIGYDKDFNITDVGSIEWTVIGTIGTIDGTGLFIALSSGSGQIKAANIESEVSATTDLILVEALRVNAVVLGNKIVHPADSSVVMLNCQLVNDFARPISVNSLVVRAAFEGAGNAAELLTDVDSVSLYIDADNNSFVGPGDYLLAAAPLQSDLINFEFDSVTIAAESSLPLLVASNVSLNARDSDSLDYYIRPREDIGTTDGTAVDAGDSLNSSGIAVIDGLVTRQISLTARPSDSLTAGDSLVYLATIDLPRNGYQTDTLKVFNIANVGSATESDIDSLILFADNGDGLWRGASAEQQVAKLVFTGNQWTRSGLSRPLPNQLNRFYVAARLAEFAENGASILLAIPENGLNMSSANDGPIDGSLVARDSVVILSDQKLQITNLSLPSRSLIPGQSTGPVLGLRMLNTTPAALTIQELVMDFTGFDPDGASQAELDDQLDSVGLYLAGDTDYGSIGSGDILIAAAPLINGSATWSNLHVLLSRAGGNAVILVAAWLNDTQPKNGNTIVFSLTRTANIKVDAEVNIAADFPLSSSGTFIVDAFPKASMDFTPTGTNSIFGGSRNQLALHVRIPSNGYSPDTIKTLQVTNLGTVNNDVITAMYLYADFNPAGFGPEDSLLATMSRISNVWTSSGLRYPVPVGGTRFCVSIDISKESFEGGTFAPAISRGGLVYGSGMTGPDDSSGVSGENILVFPPNRVTAVSIPLGTSSIYPGSSGNSLLTFALYNGYVGQSRHLNRVALTNKTISRSGGLWADQEVGQIQVYFDANRNRALDDDLLAGTGLFTDGRLTLRGMNIELPPESLSYFFVTAACPLNAIDGDSLSAAIDGATEFGFAEPVSLNGDLPLTRGGHLIINGSIAKQYNVFSIPSRTLSPGDSNIVLFAFRPAVNGDQVDTLTGFRLDNPLDASDADLDAVQLWSDVNADQQWQPTDAIIGTFSYLGGAWLVTGFNYEVDASSPPLLVTGIISGTAHSGRAFRGHLSLNSCEFKSGNDGPIDAPVAGSATFTVSTSALRVQYSSMRMAYSVGEQITLALNATNRLGVLLDSVYSQVSWVGDSTALVLDSTHSGPIRLDTDSTGVFMHYFSAVRPGTVVFRSKAIAPTIGDSSAAIETDDILIQKVPDGLRLSLHNFMPTAVARGQHNVFPLSLKLTHADQIDAASIRLKSITLSTLNGSGIPQAANSVLSRLLLADDNATLSIITAIPDSAKIRLDLNPELILRPAETAELVLLMDIADSASAANLILGIESLEAIEAVDANTDLDISVMPINPMPLRTASCRIDNPTTALAISNASAPFSGVNAGQDKVPLLGIGLRHPGTIGMSQVQLVGLSLILVSGTDTLIGSSVADRIAVYRSTELLGEVTGSLLDNKLITIDLGAGLTVNPNANDSLFVTLSIAPGIVYDSFQVILPDSSDFAIRDAVSGSEVTAVTDQDVMATGSVFPLTSSTVRVYQPSGDVSYCLSDNLPGSVVAGADSVCLLSLHLTYNQPSDYAPARISSVAILLLDSTGTPLNPGQLFDHTGYRIETGPAQYYTSLTLINGAIVFPLSDTGLVLSPSTALDISLIAGIESDAPYDNFRLVLGATNAIRLQDAVDSAHYPALTAGTPCDTALPYQSKVTSVFMPAGAPRFNPGESSVRIAGAGQKGSKIGDGGFSYIGGTQRGEIECASLKAVLFMKDGASEVTVPTSGILSSARLLHGETQIAVDSVLGADTIYFHIDPSLILAHGSSEDISLVGDIRPDAEPGIYKIKIMDSTAIVLRDKNLGTQIFPVLSAGEYPATLGTISIAELNLESSFSNYPNPFIPADGPTIITYVLPENANVDIELFTITGDPVARIAMNEFRPAGPHQDQSWDGLNGSGLKVIPGTYFCQITAHYQSGRTETARRKVSVIR